MANEFARNVSDANLNPAVFVLPSAASLSTTSAVIDVGADVFKNESIELELSVPALNSTIAPSTATIGASYIWESSTTSAFSAVAQTISSRTTAGSASGIVAKTQRCRLPSDCERYVRAKVTFSATMTDASAVSATPTVRF